MIELIEIEGRAHLGQKTVPRIIDILHVIRGLN